MTNPSDKLQAQARAVKLGRHKLAAEHEELLQWIAKQFSITALDFMFEKRQTQQLIHLVLETPEDVKRMQSDKQGTADITNRFIACLVMPVDHGDDLKSDVFPAGTSPFPEVILTFRPLKELSSEVVENIRENERRVVLKKFDSVWNVSVQVVFYFTDRQVKENQDNGTSQTIIDQLEITDKKYGFDPGSPYRFDSKETFDRDYSGNWYYYWK